jgi:uncharacterized SAM-binding protein YcdF (DUF218 family)
MKWRLEAKNWVAIPILLTLPVMLLVINIIPTFFCQAPSANSKRTQFDVIIVLGNPATSDGSPSEVMRQRVLKAVELFRTGRAKYILFTGSAVYNQFVEADVMADLARSVGIPDSALVKDPKARNTHQNLFNATEIMLENQWNSALVVTSSYHVKRTAFILSHYDVDYRVVSSSVPLKLWFWELLVGQWENYILTRLTFTGYSKSYGLTQEQVEQFKHRQ